MGGSYAYGVTMASAASIWGTGFYAGNHPNRTEVGRNKLLQCRTRLALFNNRIEFISPMLLQENGQSLDASFSSYLRKRSDCAPWVNAGAMTNKGVEFTPEHAQHPDT